MKIGYLSYRIAGNDGVSLEAERWKTILEQMGHQVTMIAGVLDRQGLLVPGLHFAEPNIFRVHEQAIDNLVPYADLESDVFASADQITAEFKELFNKFQFDKLIVANVFSLPIHFALAVALNRVVQEYQLPVLSRNHDFWWERQRYLQCQTWIPFFTEYFPPRSFTMQHVTINSLAQHQFKEQSGLDSMVIGDSFDYTNMSSQPDDYTRQWRADFGIAPDDIVFLQATRIVPRKKIELSIELVKRLADPKAVLVLAGSNGDEGEDYQAYLKYLIKQSHVRALFIGDRIKPRREIKQGQNQYTLWDCFMSCDFVTYPSEFEGFGNQFIEAINYYKPIFVNRYSVYRSDLEPLGFETVAIDNVLTDEAVDRVRQILADPALREQMAQKNYQIAQQHFSFESTARKLKELGF